MVRTSSKSSCFAVVSAAPSTGQETAQKLLAHDLDWELCRGLLLTYELEVVPVQAADAEAAARMWKRRSGLSIADRLCLATGQRLDATVWTADTVWDTSDRTRQIR